MNYNIEEDTIVAISTPPGEGGIGIVRLSGPDALKIVMSKFNTKKPYSPDPRKLYYGYFIDENEEEIDEVLVSFMPAPHSYTCEDVVEINAHGGVVSVRNILNTVLREGARLAEPGEFTRRAYVNGRIDLVQAESTLALIRAKTDKGMKAALQGVQGRLSDTINHLRGQLLETAAEIEVNVDFPHEDVEHELQHREDIAKNIKQVKEKVDTLLERHRTGKILQEGLKTVIAGKPNVGKSSLYNYLIGENRALVTDIPGTTRDLLIDFVNIKGVPLKIIDTAGIRTGGDTLEQLGINYSRQALEEADLIIFLLDATTGITAEDKYVYDEIGKKSDAARIIFVNKIDLYAEITHQEIRDTFQNDEIVFASLLQEKGLEDLENVIIQTTYAGSICGQEGSIVLEARQGELLHRAASSLQDALNSLEMTMPMDLITIDIKQAHEWLGEIVGDNMKADLLDVIFNRFCIGK